MAKKGQKTARKKTTDQEPSVEKVVSAKMGESDLRLIVEYMTLWDLSPSQLSRIIIEFEALKPGDKKALLEYSKAVAGLYEKKEGPKRRKTTGPKLEPMSRCLNM